MMGKRSGPPDCRLGSLLWDNQVVVRWVHLESRVVFLLPKADRRQQQWIHNQRFAILLANTPQGVSTQGVSMTMKRLGMTVTTAHVLMQLPMKESKISMKMK
jgi:hypothetical protein